MLASAQMDASQDRESDEYPTADRPAQYYGPMPWGVTWPMPVRVLGQDAENR